MKQVDFEELLESVRDAADSAWGRNAEAGVFVSERREGWCEFLGEEGAA